MRKIFGWLIIILLLPIICTGIGAFDPHLFWWEGTIVGFIIDGIVAILIGLILLAIDLITY